MPLKKSERRLIGGAAFAGGVAIIMLVAMPQWDAFSASTNQVNTLKEEVKNLDLQKESLRSQIALLEKNTDIPPGIIIRTYTEDNREQLVKRLLDQVVTLATGSGNKFISLAPYDADPIMGAAPATAAAANDITKTGTSAIAEAQAAAAKAQGTANTTATSTTPSTMPSASASTTDAPAAPPPVLTTFGYDLSVRGTYDTIQKFLSLMGEQKELLEVTNISLKNEANGLVPNTVSTSEIVDPRFPIRLTARIRLALQPQTN